jgi:hypothetical protein
LPLGSDQREIRHVVRMTATKVPKNKSWSSASAALDLFAPSQRQSLEMPV